MQKHLKSFEEEQMRCSFKAGEVELSVPIDTQFARTCSSYRRILKLGWAKGIQGSPLLAGRGARSVRSFLRETWALGAAPNNDTQLARILAPRGLLIPRGNKRFIARKAPVKTLLEDSVKWEY
jgi:hypothetical protein